LLYLKEGKREGSSCAGSG